MLCYVKSQEKNSFRVSLKHISPFPLRYTIQHQTRTSGLREKQRIFALVAFTGSVYAPSLLCALLHGIFLSDKTVAPHTLVTRSSARKHKGAVATVYMSMVKLEQFVSLLQAIHSILNGAHRPLLSLEIDKFLPEIFW